MNVSPLFIVMEGTYDVMLCFKLGWDALFLLLFGISNS